MSHNGKAIANRRQLSSVSWYNTFQYMNMYYPSIEIYQKIARNFHLLGQPDRLRILLAIGADEACVCHLEAWLGYRQAYISQQLKQLREAGLVVTHRQGKHIFYRLGSTLTLDLVRQAACISGFADSDLSIVRLPGPVLGCPCPECARERARITTSSEEK